MKKPILNKQIRLNDEAMTLIKHLSLLLLCNCYLVMTWRYQNSLRVYLYLIKISVCDTFRQFN